MTLRVLKNVPIVDKQFISLCDVSQGCQTLDEPEAGMVEVVKLTVWSEAVTHLEVIIQFFKHHNKYLNNFK